MKRLFCLLAAMLLLCSGAFAEDVLEIRLDDSATRVFSTDCAGLRIRKTVSDSTEHAREIRLTVTFADSGRLVLDKYYGYVGGVFDSGVLYPDYKGEADYLILLYIGGDTEVIELHYPSGNRSEVEFSSGSSDEYSGWVDE